MEYIIADLRISLPDDLVTGHFGRALAHFAVAAPSAPKPAPDTCGHASAEASPQKRAAATPFPAGGVPGPEPTPNTEPICPTERIEHAEQERGPNSGPSPNAEPLCAEVRTGGTEQGPNSETGPTPDAERACYPKTAVHSESPRPDLILMPGACPPPGDAYREIDCFDFTDADAACRFGRDAAGYLLEMSPRDGSAPARFRMRPGTPEVTTDYTLRHHPALLRFGLWTACNIAALDRLSVAIHSSVILHRGQAVLCLGESGTGKSTHTRLWREHIAGAELLNDDSPIVRVASENASAPKQWNDHPVQEASAENRTSGQTSGKPDENYLPGQAHGYPAENRTSGHTSDRAAEQSAHAGLTLGDDRLSAADRTPGPEEASKDARERAPESTSIGASKEASSSDEAAKQTSEKRPMVLACGSPWSGKTPCYRNECHPVRAFVRLSQAPHNRIRRLRPLEAIGALLPSCPPAFAHDKELFDRVCATVSAMLTHVEVYHLECRPDAEAARLVFQTLFADEVDRQ